ncbi:hypothetical protein AURDEDRAFT_174510 [Auricularia subglabra TFB-10046 SS5]|uniref:F-box domain-containing protein n=1 Tax=Auricularia subglabra (strain TFB-10046 / SS5) TaxID=717982 RepID=J0WUL2_AURST|nr:hypothetical protein AURDEDRAFT_174510 [Auricularia subglabra TFB-10046 SS5]
MFSWAPGDNIEAALAVLRRSGSASLCMNVDFGERLPAWNAEADSDPSAEGVFEAVIAHLWHVSDLQLSLSIEGMQYPSVSALFDADALDMTRLRTLSVAAPTEVPWPDIPRLNIKCSPLTSISLSRVRLATPFGLVGPATTNIDFSDLEITFSELHDMFSLAINLQRFSLLCCGILGNTGDVPGFFNSQPLSPPKLDEVSVVSGPARNLNLLHRLLSVAHAREVGVYSFRTEIPPELALEFLRIDKLGNIASLEISRNGLHIKNTAGMERNIGGDLSSFDFLLDVFAEQQIVASLREFQTSLECWMDLMRLFSRTGRFMPNLQNIRLSLSQDGFAADQALFAEDRILAPDLRSIHVSVSGSEMPTLALVQHYICALGCFFPSSLASVTVTYNDVYHEDDALLNKFMELYQLIAHTFTHVVWLTRGA